MAEKSESKCVSMDKCHLSSASTLELQWLSWWEHLTRIQKTQVRVLAGSQGLEQFFFPIFSDKILDGKPGYVIPVLPSDRCWVRKLATCSNHLTLYVCPSLNSTVPYPSRFPSTLSPAELNTYTHTQSPYMVVLDWSYQTQCSPNQTWEIEVVEVCLFLFHICIHQLHSHQRSFLGEIPP